MQVISGFHHFFECRLSSLKIIDSCKPNPCQNGGTCNKGTCSCPQHCSGKHCETCAANKYETSTGSATLSKESYFFNVKIKSHINLIINV